MAGSEEGRRSDGPPELSRRQFVLILAGLLTAVMLSNLYGNLMFTAMPTVVGKLGGLHFYSWVLTVYLLSSTVSIPVYGKLSDIYGRRPVFLLAISTFLIGSVLGGMSHGMEQFMVSRVVQGLGAGGLITTAFIVIGDLVSPRERARYQGMFAVVFTVAATVGPPLGGYLADHSWRWIFFLNVPLGVFALVAIGTVLRVPHVRRSWTVDGFGAGLLVGAVSMVLLALSLGGRHYAWEAPHIVLLLAAGAALAFLFVYWEQVCAVEPILPLRMFRNRAFALAIAGNFVIGSVSWGAALFVPLYLQIVKGYSPTMSGVLMLALTLGMFTTSTLSGLAITRIGRYRWSLVAGMIAIYGGLHLQTRLITTTPVLLVAASFVLIGGGLGMVLQPTILAAQNGVSRADLGVGTSTATFIRSLGGAFGVTVYGAIFHNRMSHWLELLLPVSALGQGRIQPSVDNLAEPQAILRLPPEVLHVVQDATVRSLHTTFLVATGVAALGVVIVLLMPDRALRGSDGSPDSDRRANPADGEPPSPDRQRAVSR